MSKENTYQALKMSGLDTSTASMISFVSLADMTKQEENLVIKAVNEAVSNIGDTLIANSGDLKQFLVENNETINLPFPEFMKYIMEIPEMLEKRKSVEGYEKLLAIVPVDKLNSNHYPYLIEKTMNEDFWRKRARGYNKTEYFDKKYGATAESLFNDAKRDYAEATTAEDKAAALRKMLP